MKRTTLAAVVIVAIMALSVCVAAGVTTAPRAHAATATTTTIYAPPTAFVARPITISGAVKTASGDLVDAAGQVALYKWFSGTTAGWQYWKTVPLVAGEYSTTDLGTYGGSVNKYQAHYLGTHGARAGWQYLPSCSCQTDVTFMSETKLSLDGDSWHYGNSVHGTLYYWTGGYNYDTNKWVYNWRPLANQSVSVYKSNTKTSCWVLLAMVKTDSSGTFQACHSSPEAYAWSDNAFRYYASFSGDNGFLGTISRTVGPL